MTIQPLTLFRVFLPFAAGYFISYLYRVVNAVIAPDLVADIGVGPSALGLLTATYFISFASFQLPLGVLLDRFGPRKVEAILLVFAALGAFIFARAESLAGLVTGRALIGFGVSACLMAAFKAYTLWFSKDKWPLVNGFQMAAGGLGALAATSPVEATLQFTDWRGVFMALALLTLLTALAVFFIVPEKKRDGTGESLQNQLRGIREIFTSRKFWRTAPLTTISQASFLSIQGLWAGPWLTHVAGFERTEVAGLLFWVAVAMIAGFITMGTIAERFSKRGVSVATTAVTGMTLFMIVQLLLIVSSVDWCVPVWLAFGFLGTSSIIAYSALSQSFPVHLSGRVTTAVNLLVFVTAFAGQWAIGGIIAFFTKVETVLSPEGFKVSFMLMLVLEIWGLLHYILAGRKQIDDV
ncbi:MAG: MFS transporter [Desulforhopalus sp.]|nr:MFS transporter [Desulforhopalus sp.]